MASFLSFEVHVNGAYCAFHRPVAPNPRQTRHLRKPGSKKPLFGVSETRCKIYSIRAVQVSDVNASVTSDLVSYVTKQPSSNVAVQLELQPNGDIHLLTTRDLGKKEAAVVVPESAWLTPVVVAKSELGPYVSDLELWLQFALFIISERSKASSNWAPYLNSLPLPPDTPLFWNPEQQKLLEGSQLLATAQGYWQFFQTRYLQLQDSLFAAQPQLFPPQVFTFEAFAAAVSAVRSRVHTPLEGADIALVPLADLVGHARKSNCSWVVKPGGGLFGRGERCLALEVASPLAAGSRLVMDFGPNKLDNVLLLDYGVLDSRSERAGYSLTLSLPEDDRFYDDKADIVESSGLGVSWQFQLLPDETPSLSMMAFLRLINLTGADAFLLEALFRNEVWAHLELPVAEDNERAACLSMIQGCREALQGYPTTIDEDLALLRSSSWPAGSPEERAVQVCLGEKEAIEATLRFFEDRLEIVDRLEYYAERRLKRLGLLDEQGKNTYESYFEGGIA